jgi:hypothetical protein
MFPRLTRADAHVTPVWSSPWNRAWMGRMGLVVTLPPFVVDAVAERGS